MYFLIDKKRKIIFGWSAKCGCTHLKNIYNYYNGIKKDINELHNGTYNTLPKDYEEYEIIIVIRNPYERIVSGFRDKYLNNNDERIQIKHIKKEDLTFELFVEELYEHKYRYIDKHHFTPQLSEAYIEGLKKHKKIKYYDIKKIDYNYLNKLYNDNLPKIYINWKGQKDHCTNDSKKRLKKKVYNLKPYTIYNSYKIKPKYFYNEEIKSKVEELYKKDFEYFKSIGFNYEI